MPTIEQRQEWGRLGAERRWEGKPRPVTCHCGRPIGRSGARGHCARCYRRYWNTTPAGQRWKKGKQRERTVRRLDIIKALGARCVCCGEEAIEFLTIDHIRGDGAAHRRLKGHHSKLYRDIINSGVPRDRFRVLCWNCNCSRATSGYCPHNPTDIQRLGAEWEGDLGETQSGVTCQAEFAHFLK